MFCWKCGAQNPEGAQRCGSCGQVLAMVVLAAPPVPGVTSGLAIAAFVLGILSPFTCMLTLLPAVILAIVALVKISHSAGRLRGTGLAIAGICAPIVLLPVAAVGMGIMMPALARVRQLAFRMTCGTNLHSLGIAMRAYAADNNGQFPTSSQWCDLLLMTMNVTPEMFQCKGGGGERCHYALNRNIAGLGFNAPGDMVLLFESYPGWNQVGGPEILTTEYHQQDGCNVVFVDGQAAFIRPAGLAELRWTVNPRGP
jgi:hypothetical protein